MNNVLTIAGKEFNDLLNSKLVIITLLVYSILLVMFTYTNYDVVIHYGFGGSDKAIRGLIGVLVKVLADYGSVVALVVGFYSIYKEKASNALSTLIVKPLYRDTIINGKLLGSMAFLACTLGLMTSLYLCMVILLYGSMVDPYIMPLLELLPLALFISLITVVMFLSMSMLISIVVKDHSLALFLGILLWLIVIDTVPTMSFAGNIGFLFGADRFYIENFLVSMSPKGMANHILIKMTGLTETILVSMQELVKLSLYALVCIILNYIVFLRKDVV